jgi:hypothetical protein
MKRYIIPASTTSVRITLPQTLQEIINDTAKNYKTIDLVHGFAGIMSLVSADGISYISRDCPNQFLYLKIGD